MRHIYLNISIQRARADKVPIRVEVYRPDVRLVPRESPDYFGGL